MALVVIGHHCFERRKASLSKIGRFLEVRVTLSVAEVGLYIALAKSEDFYKYMYMYVSVLLRHARICMYMYVYTCSSTKGINSGTSCISQLEVTI